MKRAISIEFGDNIVSVVLEQRNLAAMCLSVYPFPCKTTISALRTSAKEDFLLARCRQQ